MTRLISRLWLLVLVASVAEGCSCGKGSGNGIRPNEGSLTASPPRLDFGNVPLNQHSALHLKLTNSGSGELTIESQTLTGDTTGSFSSQTFPTAFAIGSSNAALVTFAPTQAGPLAAQLVFLNDGEPSPFTVDLTGTGLDINVTCTPTSVSFGPVQVGAQPPPEQMVTCTNNGGSPTLLSVSAVNTDPQFTVSDTNGPVSASNQVTLAPGGTYTVTVAYEPSGTGPVSSSFTYTACANPTTCANPQSIPLTGTGIAGQLSLTPDPISFSNVPAGQQTTQVVTATNIGSSPLTVSCLNFDSLSGGSSTTSCQQASSQYSFSSFSQALPVTLMPNQSFTFTLGYTASSTGNDTNQIDAFYTSGGSLSEATDAITGDVVNGPCNLSISPASVTFVGVVVGTAQTQSATLSNSGLANCNITAVAIDTSSDPSFSLAAGQSTSFTIASGATATIGVTINLDNNHLPNARRGQLDFQSDDPSFPSVQVPLLATLQSAYAGGGAWPRWHHDNTQSGLSPSDTSGLSGVIDWTVNIGAPGSNPRGSGAYDYLNSPVVGADGMIYQVGMSGTLYAFTPDGGTHWSTFLEGPLVDPHPSTPIIASDNSLYVAFGETSMGGGSSGGLTNAFYHVSPSGTILTSIPPVSGGDGFDLPPMLTNGGLLLGGDDRNGAFAFNIASGFTLSNTYSGGGRLSQADQMSAAVGPDDSSYWCQGGTCVGLTPPSAGFAPIAAWPAGGLNGVGGSSNQSTSSDIALDVAFTGNLIVLFGDWGATSWNIAQQLTSINPANGTVVWTVTLPAPSPAQYELSYPRTGDATVGNSCPAIGTDGTVYVGNFDGLHAFNGTTGQEIAGFPFKTSSAVLTAPAIGGDGTIFVGTADGTFYAVNPVGTQRFSLTAGGRISGSPAIGPNGNVYFVADDGNLYAVR